MIIQNQRKSKALPYQKKESEHIDKVRSFWYGENTRTTKFVKEEEWL
jgi:hypothetical protein